MLDFSKKNINNLEITWSRADIIINHYETTEQELKCNMIIKNELVFNKLSTYFITPFLIYTFGHLKRRF